MYAYFCCEKLLKIFDLLGSITKKINYIIDHVHFICALLPV